MTGGEQDRPARPPLSGPRTLRELAEVSGIDAADIDAAEADGTLGLLLVDRLVAPTTPRYTLQDVAARSSLGEDVVRLWRALGFPDPDPSERTFGDEDVELLGIVETALRYELLDRATALQLARAIGAAAQRIAQSQIDAIGARIDAGGPGGGEIAVQRAQLLLPQVPRIIDHVWRRHLQVAARRRMAGAAMAAGGNRVVCVGFADLVGFTALSQQLPDEALAALVDRFESTAYDVVGGLGGRVVKMIGDEVMFEVPEAGAAVEVGLALSAAYHDDEAVTDVRVGIASGPVLAREGDLFGPTVNLASRIVSIAYPGSVLVSEEVCDQLGGDERFACKPIRPRILKDIGRVRLYVVRRAEDAGVGLAERARRRRLDRRFRG